MGDKHAEGAGSGRAGEVGGTVRKHLSLQPQSVGRRRQEPGGLGKGAGAEFKAVARGEHYGVHGSPADVRRLLVYCNLHRNALLGAELGELVCGRHAGWARAYDRDIPLVRRWKLWPVYSPQRIGEAHEAYGDEPYYAEEGKNWNGERGYSDEGDGKELEDERGGSDREDKNGNDRCEAVRGRGSQRLAASGGPPPKSRQVSLWVAREQRCSLIAVVGRILPVDGRRQARLRFGTASAVIGAPVRRRGQPLLTPLVSPLFVHQQCVRGMDHGRVGGMAAWHGFFEPLPGSGRLLR